MYIYIYIFFKVLHSELSFVGRETVGVAFLYQTCDTLLTSDWSNFSLRSLTQNITRLAVEYKLLWR